MELSKILNEVKTEVIRRNCYVPISMSYIDELAKVCNALHEEMLKVCDASSVLSDSLNKFSKSNPWLKTSVEIDKYSYGLNDYALRKHIYGNI